jgi:hypothetical protein
MLFTNLSHEFWQTRCFEGVRFLPNSPTANPPVHVGGGVGDCFGRKPCPGSLPVPTMATPMGAVPLLGDVVVFHPYPPWSFPGENLVRLTDKQWRRPRCRDLLGGIVLEPPCQHCECSMTVLSYATPWIQPLVLALVSVPIVVWRAFIAGASASSSDSLLA